VSDKNLYDYPRYYDVIFGSDWKAEYDFLLACFNGLTRRTVKRVFEPACGTGRLLYRLAKAGYEVSGLDLNARAVHYCNRRLERHGFSPTAGVGDMSCFRLKRKVDAAFNMINGDCVGQRRPVRVGAALAAYRRAAHGGRVLVGSARSPVCQHAHVDDQPG
jgi:SAM-dependent methyltransferase